MQAASKPSVNPWLIAMVTSLAAFMEVLDTTITNVSLSHIAGTLGASQDESTWVITSYLVANGIVLPLSGWLSDVMGRKRFFLFCIAAFTAASFACGVAGSLEMLIFFRLLQGLAGGGLQPTQQAIIVDAFPPEKRGAAFGVTGITMITAPILGPTLGGYITDNFSWEWIFFMNVPVGIIAFFLVSRFVPDAAGQADRPNGGKLNGGKPNGEKQGEKKPFSIDYIGLGLIAIGLGALQIVLDKGQQDDWFSSHFILFFSALSGFCLVGAVLWLLRQRDPVVELRLLGLPSFGLASLMMFFTGFCLYGGSTLLPIALQSEYGYSATLAGLVLSPSGFIVILLMPISGRLVGLVPARYLVIIGMTLTSIGMWATTHMTPTSSYGMFVMMRSMQVLGLPFLFIPISTLAFVDIPKEKNNKASAIFAMSRNLGGSFGISLLSSYLARREQARQSQLAQHLSAGDIGYRQAVARTTQAALNHHIAPLDAFGTALGRMYHELLHQADILAFVDSFALMSLVSAVMIGVAFFLPYNNPRARKGAEAAVH